MVREIRDLIEFSRPHVRDAETLDRLRKMVDDRGSWSKAHHLFDHIRHKTLRAERAKDDQAIAQYMFEEACAKALFNLTRGAAPFDADSPYWVVPNALVCARSLGLDQMEVVNIVTTGD